MFSPIVRDVVDAEESTVSLPATDTLSAVGLDDFPSSGRGGEPLIKVDLIASSLLVFPTALPAPRLVAAGVSEAEVGDRFLGAASSTQNLAAFNLSVAAGRTHNVTTVPRCRRRRRARQTHPSRIPEKVRIAEVDLRFDRLAPRTVAVALTRPRSAPLHWNTASASVGGLVSDITWLAITAKVICFAIPTTVLREDAQWLEGRTGRAPSCSGRACRSRFAHRPIVSHCETQWR